MQINSVRVSAPRTSPPPIARLVQAGLCACGCRPRQLRLVGDDRAAFELDDVASPLRTSRTTPCRDSQWTWSPTENDMGIMYSARVCGLDRLRDRKRLEPQDDELAAGDGPGSA